MKILSFTTLFEWGRLHENISIVSMVPLFSIVLLLLLFRKMFFISIERMETRRQKAIPVLIKTCVVFLIYFLGVLIISWHYLGFNAAKLTFITSLTVGSIIYLLQQLLRDGLSGILLNLSSPFSVLDFVKIGEYYGRVIDITWRGTILLTDDNNIINIPNNKVAEKEVLNFTRPDPISRTSFEITMPAAVDVTTLSVSVLRGLKTATTMGRVLVTPSASVELRGYTYTQSSPLCYIMYKVSFYFDVRLCSPNKALNDALICVTQELKNDSLFSMGKVLDEMLPSQAELPISYVQKKLGEYALLSPQQVQLIKNSWAVVLPVADKMVELFYLRLFEKNTVIKKLFRTSHTEQRNKFISMLNFIVSQLERPEGLVAAAQELALRHKLYGVKNEHYDVVGSILLDTFTEVLGDAFTPEIRESWLSLYVKIAGVMKDV